LCRALQILILSFGSLAASTPYLGVILLVIIFMWIRAAGVLEKEFTAAQEGGALEPKAGGEVVGEESKHSNGLGDNGVDEEGAASGTPVAGSAA
jgi:TLC ATP/ADP transporter